jgi:Mg2+-importing ATPase
VAVAIVLPILPVGRWFGFVTPPLMIFVYVIPVTVAYLALVEVMKILFYRLAVRRR